MLDDVILNYVRQNLTAGYTEDQVKQGLLEAGFDELSVNQAFEQVEQESQSQDSQNGQQNNQQNDSQSQNNQLSSQNNNQNNSSKSSSNLNNFKTIFIGFAAIVGFLLFAGVFLVLIRGGSDGTSNFDGSTDLSDSSDSNGFSTDPWFDDNDDFDTNISDQDSDLSDDYIFDDDSSLIPDPSLPCRLGVSTRNLFVNINQNIGLIAHGNQGTDTQVNWKIDDDSIARLNPSSSRYTVVTGVSEGQTRITAVDLAVGDSCSYTVIVNVKDE